MTDQPLVDGKNNETEGEKMEKLIVLLMGAAAVYLCFFRKAKPNGANTYLIKSGHWAAGSGCFYNSGEKNGKGYLQMFNTLPASAKFITFPNVRALYKITERKRYSDFGESCVTVSYEFVKYQC